MAKNTILKTAVIWNDYEKIKYLIVDGDWSRFEDVYINSAEDDDDLQQELSSLLYKEGKFLFSETSKKEFVQQIRQGAEIIECGFLP